MTILVATLGAGALLVSACSGAATPSHSTAPPSVAASPAASAVLNTASAAAPASAAPNVAITPAPVSPSPGGPVYLKSGTATVHFTVGSKKASITVPLAKGESRIDEDNSLAAEWDNLSNNAITEGLQLVIPKGKSGTYAVDYNNNYITFYVEILNPTSSTSPAKSP